MKKARPFSSLVILMRVKGTVSRDFCFRFFHESSSPKPQKLHWVISNFFDISRIYSLVQVHHWCQLHRWPSCHRYQRNHWKILPLVPLVLLIPVANLPHVSAIPEAPNLYRSLSTKLTQYPVYILFFLSLRCQLRKTLCTSRAMVVGNPLSGFAGAYYFSLILCLAGRGLPMLVTGS